jgi:hypothetical protein
VAAALGTPHNLYIKTHSGAVVVASLKTHSLALQVKRLLLEVPEFHLPKALDIE